METVPIRHLEEPPESGSLDFSVAITPVSHQAESHRRRTVKETVASIVKPVKYLLSGEVQIEIEWLIHERERYESDTSPDVDNILKPLLDGLCGPEGLLIDDCQVQAIDCRWIDWTLNEQQVNFRIRFSSDVWVKKSGLVFVHIERGLCFPICQDHTPETQLIVLNLCEELMKYRNRIEESTGDYYAAKSVMPIQRLFHKSRLQAFKKLELETLRAKLQKAT